MRAVNLLPRDGAKSRSVTAENLPAVVGAGVGFVVVAALAGGYLSASSKVAAAQGVLDAKKAQLAAMPLPPEPTVDPDATPPAVASEQGPRLQAVSAALSQRIAWDRILREFSLMLPNDVWVSSLQLTAANGQTSPNGFTINGQTYSYDSVARMLTRMAMIPDLADVSLTTTSRSGRLVSFGVNATIKGLAAPAPPPVPAPAPATTPSSDEGATPSAEGASG